MDFPFSAGILEKIRKSVPEEGAKKIEAINRAMLADALEKSGNTKAAFSEYMKAANLLGSDTNVDRVRKIVQGVISSDNELLRLEKQYTYSKENE